MNNQISLSINRQQHTLEVKPNEMLLDLIHYRPCITGTKIGCDETKCVVCTILVGID